MNSRIHSNKKMTAACAVAAATGFLQISSASAKASPPPRSSIAGIHATLWGSSDVCGSSEPNTEEGPWSIPRGGNDDASSEAETTEKKQHWSKKKKRRNKKGKKDAKKKETNEEHAQSEIPTYTTTEQYFSSAADNDTETTMESPEQRGNPMMEEILQSDDYYEILGLTRGETNVHKIKKAYRRRAVLTHPDKTGGDRRAFDMVAEAYDVLQDGEKKSIYDRYGKDGLDPTKGAGMASSAEDLFRSFFGGSAFHQQQQPRRRTNRTLRYQLEVTLEDLYRGLTRKVTVEAPSRGFYSQHQDNASKDVEVSIPRGSHAGQSIVLSGEMDFDSKDSPPGDLVFQLFQRPHKTFTRKGHDLAVEMKISFQEAICGCTRTIKHLDGREFAIESAKHAIMGDERSPANVYIQTGDVQVLKGQGMPKDSQGLEFGDLYVQYHVELPKSSSTEHLTTSERIELARLLEKLEGRHEHNKQSNPKANATTYTLQRASVRDFGRASGSVPSFDDGFSGSEHDHNSFHPFGGAHRQFFWSSSGRSPFFGQQTNFEDDENVQCRQM